MQVIFHRSGTPNIPTINNVLLDTIDAEHSCVEITFDDIKHELVGFESLYPYFINGQIAETRCGDRFIIGGKKYNKVLYNLTSLESDPISASNYNWDYTYYNDDGYRNTDYDIMSFWELTSIANLADARNGDYNYMILANRIAPKFDEIRLKDDLIWVRA